MLQAGTQAPTFALPDQDGVASHKRFDATNEEAILSGKGMERSAKIQGFPGSASGPVRGSGAVPGCMLAEQGCIAHGVPMLVAYHQLKDLFYCIQLSLKKELRSEGKQVTDVSAVAAREAAWACVLDVLGRAGFRHLGELPARQADVLPSIMNPPTPRDVPSGETAERSLPCFKRCSTR